MSMASIPQADSRGSVFRSLSLPELLDFSHFSGLGHFSGEETVWTFSWPVHAGSEEFDLRVGHGPHVSFKGE